MKPADRLEKKIKDDKLSELYRLMTDEIFGPPREEDRQRLKQLLEEPWAKQEWITFRKTFKDQATIDNIARLANEDTSLALTTTIRKRRNKRLLKRAVLCSGMVVLSIAAWSYLNRTSISDTREQLSALSNYPVAAPAAVDTRLSIQLSTGLQLNLSANENRLDDSTVIYNDTATRTLSFITGDCRSRQLNTLKVPPGMDYHIRLHDGTEVFLNASSLLSFPFRFGQDKREIFIEGEAFLQVAPQAGKPFIVHLPSTSVEVLGTSFNINTYDSNKITVSLQEGAVRLNTPGQQPVRLQPGMQAVVQHQSATTTVQPFAKEELSWTQGAYTMDNTPLGVLAMLLPRWFGIQVVFDKPALREERFTGTILKKEPLATFLSALERTANVHTYYKNGILHFQ